MKKALKPKRVLSKVQPLALPAGVTAYKGSTKGLKKWFARPELETSGGCRSVHSHAIGKHASR